MNRFKLFLVSASMFVLPLAVTHAQLTTTTGGNAGPFTDTLKNIGEIINNILVPLLLTLGFLMFVWGMFKFFIVGGADEDARNSGKSLMIYAVLAFVLIISFWGLINFLSSSIGLEGKTLDNVPTANFITP